MVVRETTHRFSRLSFHRAMVGRRLPLLKTASGLTWLAFCPEQERKELIEMLASRPGDDYQLAREPLKLQAILARARKEGYGQNYRGWDQEEKIASIAVPLRSEQRVIGCLNLVYMASAMTIEQAAEKHLPALQRVAKQIEEGVESQAILVKRTAKRRAFTLVTPMCNLAHSHRYSPICPHAQYGLHATLMTSIL